MKSLCARLVILTLLGVTAVMSTSGVGLYLTFRARMRDQMDRSLRERARTLAGLIERQKRTAGFARGLNASKLLLRDEHMQIFVEESAQQATAVGDDNLPRFFGPLDQPILADIQLPDGRPGRAVSLAFVPDPFELPKWLRDRLPVQPLEDENSPNPVVVELVLARATEPMDRALAELKIMLLAVGLSAAGVVAWLLSVLVRRGLRPVGDLGEAIAAIDARELGKRIELSHAPSELVPVIDRLNQLTGRLAEVFERERSFTANVAHELRTPLAGLRATLELALSRPREAEVYRTAADESLAIVIQTQTLVEGLLMLARLESGREVPDIQAIDLSDLLAESWALRAEAAAKKALTTDQRVPEAFSLSSDLRLLRLAVEPLLDNAVAHAPSGANVIIEVTASAGRCRIRIENPGAAITPEQLEQVFEPFWRGDAARGQTGLHAGLGMAIARRAARALNGDVTVAITPKKAFCVVVDLPVG